MREIKERTSFPERSRLQRWIGIGGGGHLETDLLADDRPEILRGSATRSFCTMGERRDNRFTRPKRDVRLLSLHASASRRCVFRRYHNSFEMSIAEREQAENKRLRRLGFAAFTCAMPNLSRKSVSRLALMAVGVLDEAFRIADHEPVEGTALHKLALGYLMVVGVTNPSQATTFWQLLRHEGTFTQMSCRQSHAGVMLDGMRQRAEQIAST